MESLQLHRIKGVPTEVLKIPCPSHWLYMQRDHDSPDVKELMDKHIPEGYRYAGKFASGNFVNSDDPAYFKWRQQESHFMTSQLFSMFCDVDVTLPKPPIPPTENISAYLLILIAKDEDVFKHEVEAVRIIKNEVDILMKRYSAIWKERIEGLNFT